MDIIKEKAKMFATKKLYNSDGQEIDSFVDVEQQRMFESIAREQRYDDIKDMCEAITQMIDYGVDFSSENNPVIVEIIKRYMLIHEPIEQIIKKYETQ